MTAMFLKYFVPHESNDYKPHLLRNEVALGILALILILEGAFLSQALLFGSRSGFLALILPNTLVDETNQQRVAANLSPLAVNPILTAAAQEKANDMASKSYFAHTSPAGVTPWYWFDQVGYKYTYAGENLAVNFSDSQDVTNAWMNSPLHRDNILNSHYTEIGIATAQGTYEGQPTVFVVQLFGRPAAPQPAAATTPAPAPAPQPKPPVIAQNPTPKPVPQPKPVVVTTTVATSTPSTTAPAPAEPSSSETFVAVAGESASSSASGTAAAVTGATAAGSTLATAQSNLIQRIFSAPREAIDLVYVVLGLIVAMALGLKVFVRMEQQHPRLVLNGLAIIFVLATLAVVNQHLLLAHAKIF